MRNIMTRKYGKSRSEVPADLIVVHNSVGESRTSA